MSERCEFDVSDVSNVDGPVGVSPAFPAGQTADMHLKSSPPGGVPASANRSTNEVARTSRGLPAGWVYLLKRRQHPATELRFDCYVNLPSNEGGQLRSRTQLSQYLTGRGLSETSFDATVSFRATDFPADSFHDFDEAAGASRLHDAIRANGSVSRMSKRGRKRKLVATAAAAETVPDSGKENECAGRRSSESLGGSRGSSKSSSSDAGEDVVPIPNAETVGRRATRGSSRPSLGDVESGTAAELLRTISGVGAGDPWRFLVAACFLDVSRSALTPQPPSFSLARVLDDFFAAFPTAADFDAVGWIEAADFLAERGAGLGDGFAKRLAGLTYDFLDARVPVPAAAVAAEMSGVNEFVLGCYREAYGL